MTPIPTLADLTAEWLTTLLRDKGHDCEIGSVSARAIGTGQVGATYRLALDYSRGTGPATLIAKLPSNDPTSRATGKSHLTYLREARFYQTFAGRKPLPVPEHLFIAFDDDSHDFALVMRDLPRHVAGNQLAVPTHEEAGHAIDAAAAIHAGWWGDPMLDTLDWLNGSKAVPPPLDIEALYAMFWPAFRQRYGNRVTADMTKVGDAFAGKLKPWVDARSGPRCLTHNDFRPDNMLFDLGDQSRPVVVVDWQTVGVGNGAGDLGYFMGTALDPPTRAREERNLVDRYCRGLSAAGVPQGDLGQVWDDYRAAAFSGFLMGVTASMVVGQTDRGDTMFLTMCDRSAAMALDHAGVALP